MLCYALSAGAALPLAAVRAAFAAMGLPLLSPLTTPLVLATGDHTNSLILSGDMLLAGTLLIAGSAYMLRRRRQ